MRWRARVHRSTGRTRHYRARTDGDLKQRGEELPLPAWVEIEADDGGFNLLYFAASGECQTDTWHETLALAKAQAHFEFAVDEAEWEALDDPPG